jgi:hypothetical protein
MVTEVYIWFDYTKPSGSKSSHIDWIGKIDTDKAKSAIDKIKAEDMLKVQSSKFFSQDVTLSISMQEIATGNVLYRRNL